MPLARILVVDDEPQLAATLRDLLQNAGYLVKVAVSGSEALNLLPVFQPDVVLLDVMMPGVTGDEVLTHLRREHPCVPVVMVTAIQDAQAARQMLTRGAFDYLPKPFQMDVLERIVGAAVASRQR
jgi:DNA-binding response OmpR family regulator